MNNAMRFTLVFLILTLVLPWSVLAQEAQETEKSPESLELPDVIVYGVDTSFRQGGEKCAPAPYMASAVVPQGEIAYPAAVHSAGEVTFSESGQSFSDRHTLLSSYIGPYTSWGLRALHQRMWKKADIRLFANLEGTDGQYDNGDGTWGEIQGKVDVPVSGDIACGLDLGYRRWSYGLYGSKIDKEDVTQDLFSAKAQVEARQSEQTSVQAGLGYQRLAISFSKRPDIFEDLFQADLGLQTRYYTVDILSHIKWVGDHPSTEGLIRSAGDLKTTTFDLPSGDLLTMTCEAKSEVLPRLSAGLGATLQSYMSKEENDRTRLFPKAEACCRPVRPLAIHASLQGGFRHYPLAELFRLNAYTGYISSPVFEERQWQVETAIEAEVRPDLILKGSYQWTEDRDAMFWQWDDRGFFFIEDRLKEVRQHRLEVSAKYTLRSSGKAQIGYTYTDYEIRDPFYSTVNGSDRIPFLPRHELWATAEYSIPAWFDVRADMRRVGERISRLMRPYDSYFNPHELDPYFLLNVELQRNVLKNIDAFIYLRNLTDSDYALWYNYPEMGVNIYGGVKIVL